MYCHRLPGVELPRRYRGWGPRKSGQAEGWLTLADVSLREAPDGAFDGDWLRAATLHRLQVPGHGVFLHDVHHLTSIGVGVCHPQVLLRDACDRPWERMRTEVTPQHCLGTGCEMIPGDWRADYRTCSGSKQVLGACPPVSIGVNVNLPTFQCANHPWSSDRSPFPLPIHSSSSVMLGLVPQPTSQYLDIIISCSVM